MAVLFLVLFGSFVFGLQSISGGNQQPQTQTSQNQQPQPPASFPQPQPPASFPPPSTAVPEPADGGLAIAAGGAVILFTLRKRLGK